MPSIMELIAQRGNKRSQSTPKKDKNLLGQPDGQDIEMKASRSQDRSRTSGTDGVDTSTNDILPTHEVNQNGHRVTTGIQPAGESGRKGIHPIHFMKIVWRSTSRASRICNVFWPVVPAAIAVRYARPDQNLAIFILNYIAMVPCANLIGFAGQELARKMHKVWGVLLETTLGSIVEIVLFIVLLRKGSQGYPIIRAAILGSVLATQLFCLGMCFMVGGIRHNELEFSEVVGEVGSDLLLTA